MYNDPRAKLFGGPNTSTTLSTVDASPLATRWSVDSTILSIAETDTSEDLTLLQEAIVGRLGATAALIRTEDVQVVKIIACAVGRRAARLAGMAIGAVILQTWSSKTPNDESTNYIYLEKDEVASAAPLDPDPEIDIVDIGVDGSVIEHYPGFESRMREIFRSIDGIGVEGERRIRIGIAKDGSSVGAAIIALLASQS